ncbi:helix-turn-helix domain-containing protein [Actinoplanes sp. NPDC051513]|uniref:helix-turn-helix domain-containing protein n=1 Tax=Actinoplanes sp. NPDC051513 TaxID=3363908 RepID=UPI00379BA729
MPEQVGQAVARERLRARLVELRRLSGLSPDAVTSRTHWSLSKLNRIETGAVTVQPLDAQALLQIYGIDDPGEVANLTDLAITARRRQWWSGFQLEPEVRDFVAYESTASRITTYQALHIPDLMQTEAYARTALTAAAGKKPDDPAVQGALELLQRRQTEVAARRPEIQAVLDGAVLERRVGGSRVMRAQLDRLVEVIGEGLMRIVVVPLRHGLIPGPGGGFELLGFPGVEDPDVVFVESPVRNLLVRDKDVIAGYHDAADTLIDSGLTRDAAIREIRRVRNDL